MYNPSILRWIIITLIITTLSCRSPISDRYTEDELVRIMLDAHTLGLIYNRQDLQSDSLKKAYYEVLEQRYGLSREEFQKVVDGLIMDSELYDKVYSRMTKKMEDMEHMDMQGSYN